MILACCKLYISESRNKAALESIERVAKLVHDTKVVNKIEDETYNRVGYTLVSKLPTKLSLDLCPLKDTAFAMVSTALKAIDFNMHGGSHPRLGVVDHICFHHWPVLLWSRQLILQGPWPKMLAPSLKKHLGRDDAVEKVDHLGHLKVEIEAMGRGQREYYCFKQDSSDSEIPTFLYGAAHEKGQTLDSGRRELGYFRPNMNGNIWAGGLSSETLPLHPDEGPNQADLSKGVVVIGSTRWVDNYNVPIFSTNLSAVRRIAKLVSERGGGLPSVQAMALSHGEEVIEVACNLLEPNKVGGDKVQIEVEHLA
uniref:Formiminotransferase N-terminal subdomain domain-containing protein n=1 Tax=Chenopodium quinoa TaxID=63459 RepID=A0A803MHJ8_CHEQI